MTVKKTSKTDLDVDYVARLANLPLTLSQRKKFAGQLSQVLEYVSQIQKQDISGVTETAQVSGQENVMREDEVKPGLTQEEALANAPSVHNGFFRVNYVFEE
ncbi:Asp-tRNA(Asn)/Glu-tRNA(Gln) amidotransferase subunit GatC [Patescibacteria group bacterium]|nr:Asp-tRNA(Asn)/Glu-tRNA(Gln) amidotransferase subunit GatC [Patescibacteria group bacterium]MBU1472835.1 Asp-tRNA(Asn)/Glu-tRNA(Gln) amidotransferase subunit GatC [Patescibacteria group bacterium]MBU2460357.1 Asp-tRNA(Asn)/Glu-tRNA(Gln) amidotransferase subunit GatC [Patescibacteria group bacterium]MBU2543891.1 Asp-tRNA(Asn)/Glu-tRNA(Gln) amidotransferase subunit GatC [Patescibacteria group bacterium]